MDGRRRLIERLGSEAADPIEELLNAALAFENDDYPSLQRFIDWFDRGEVEIVRDAAAQGDMLRLLTVHGAKGLQAPIVILADACLDPDAGNRADSLEWNGLPIIAPRKAERQGEIGRVAEEASAVERAEHWRLLYVALTRAEERLVVTGSLGPGPGGGQARELVCRRRGRAGLAGGGMGGRSALGCAPQLARREILPPKAAESAVAESGTVHGEPVWLRKPAPVEARPPRPLAPSAAVEDDVPYPPPTPAMRDAAERGRWLHRLFERLADVPPDSRSARADNWLAQQGLGDAARRHDVIEQALRVIEDPRFAALFGPDALAEAPIAAVVGEAVIAGTVDRLRIGDDLVQLVDFKTGRISPLAVEEVPLAHVRQMAAYAAALQVIFPGRRIEAGLLYTAAPRLITLPPELLARHKPGFPSAQENLPLPTVETDATPS